jgi:hypothetical protein
MQHVLSNERASVKTLIDWSIDTVLIRILWPGFARFDEFFMRLYDHL